MLMNSRLLFKVSRICMLAGALITLVSLAIPEFPTLGVSFNSVVLPVLIGIGVLALGYYLRRKANELQRRFEWRESYAQAHY